MGILNKLQQYKWTKQNINNIIDYVKTKQLPSSLKTLSQKKAFVEKFGTDFITVKGNLVYKPLNLIAVPSDDDAIKDRVLTQVYKSPEALGKGQNALHSLVLTKFLGIKRRDVIEFLKKQPTYQLYQTKPRIVSKGIQAKYPFQYWAIDLVQVDNLAKYRDNKNHNFIFTCVDLFSRFVWWFPMKKKEASNSLEAFKKILKYNLRFYPPQLKRRKERLQEYDYPNTILIDNGKEFEGVFAQFMKDKGIKMKTTNSYSPQVNAESMNGILRNLMRAKFIRNQNLVWLPYLDDFMKSKNTNKNEETGEMPEKILKDFFKVDGNKAVIKQSQTRIQERKVKQGMSSKERVNRYKNQEFEKGDLVRVKLSNFQSAIRDKIKSGNMKQVIVKFSPSVYEVEKVIPVKPNATASFPLYVLKDAENRTILNENGKKRIFKGADLLKVPRDTLPSTINLKKVNFLNRVANEEGTRARDLYIEQEEEGDDDPQQQEQTPKVTKPKSPKFYTLKEWNEELEGKTFVDEGVKWIIYEVYKEKNRLVADYYDSKFANRSEDYIKNMTKPYSYLKEILRMSVNEDWFKPIYNEYLDPVKRK